MSVVEEECLRCSLVHPSSLIDNQPATLTHFLIPFVDYVIMSMFIQLNILFYSWQKNEPVPFVQYNMNGKIHWLAISTGGLCFQRLPQHEQTVRENDRRLPPSGCSLSIPSLLFIIAIVDFGLHRAD